MAAVLPREVWERHEAAHHARVDALLERHLDRGRRGEAHPVEDFLFTYYSLRPAQLRRWHPGAGVALLDAGERASWRDHVAVDGAVMVDVRTFLDRRADAVRHARTLLAATAERPAQLGCFGLHEWAMVYREPRRRHPVPLRLGEAGTDAVVESHRIRCSHFDAYRFFTAAAAPRNALRPDRASTVALEQPGCLHATMDLYKWAYKLLPVVPSELVADAFELARDVRELDMRASPYDLSAHGYEPVRIETAAGKAAYVAAQREFAERGPLLRARLLAALDPLPLEAACSSSS
ncbi:MAG TPA: 3-methyladenine DNA glycosylase [Kineosporiaceae bacterium]|nr:3-methyladenine DNA glycosylase [Kineosporiaceae bacterium]